VIVGLATGWRRLQFGRKSIRLAHPSRVSSAQPSVP
jgi:hypothetical protein